MEPKYIFLNELGFDSIHRFSLNSEKKISKIKNIFDQKTIYFHTNLKDFVKIKAEIEKWNDYDKFVQVSIFFWKIIDENKKCIDLKEIEKFTDQRGFVNKTENYKLERNNIFRTEYKFYYAIEKNVRSIFIYSPYQQLIGKGLRFKYECDLNTIKISKDSKTTIEVLE